MNDPTHCGEDLCGRGAHVAHLRLGQDCGDARQPRPGGVTVPVQASKAEAVQAFDGQEERRPHHHDFQQRRGPQQVQFTPCRPNEEGPEPDHQADLELARKFRVAELLVGVVRKVPLEGDDQAHEACDAGTEQEPPPIEPSSRHATSSAMRHQPSASTEAALLAACMV